MAETAHHNFRLTSETLARLDYLQSVLGLSSRAEVIRHAIGQLHFRVTQEEKRIQKKSQKTT